MFGRDKAKCKDDNVRYLLCEYCGKIVAVVRDSGVSTMCCGGEMADIRPEKVEELMK